MSMHGLHLIVGRLFVEPERARGRSRWSAVIRFHKREGVNVGSVIGCILSRRLASVAGPELQLGDRRCRRVPMRKHTRLLAATAALLLAATAIVAAQQIPRRASIRSAAGASPVSWAIRAPTGSIGRSGRRRGTGRGARRAQSQDRDGRRRCRRRLRLHDGQDGEEGRADRQGLRRRHPAADDDLLSSAWRREAHQRRAGARPHRRSEASAGVRSISSFWSTCITNSRSRSRCCADCAAR